MIIKMYTLISTYVVLTHLNYYYIINLNITTVGRRAMRRYILRDLIQHLIEIKKKYLV